MSPINKDQLVKILKAALYVGVSAILGYFIALTTDQPELFGVFTPLINVILVTLKQLFTSPSK